MRIQETALETGRSFFERFTRIQFTDKDSLVEIDNYGGVTMDEIVGAWSADALFEPGPSDEIILRKSQTRYIQI